MASSRVPILIRPSCPGDVGLIHSSWLKSYLHHGPEELRDIPERIYFKGQDERINRILQQAQVAVACNPEHEDQVYGWICFDAGLQLTIHYCFVRKMWRCEGVALSLYRRAGGSLNGGGAYTHWTDSGATLARRFDMTFNPYLAR